MLEIKYFSLKSPLLAVGVTNLSVLPDRERYSNDARNCDNESKFPVPLQRPEYYSVSLEQEERVQSLQIEEVIGNLGRFILGYLVYDEMEDRRDPDLHDVLSESLKKFI